MSASPDNALAIASFEDAIIASAGPEFTTDPTASRKDLVTRALLSNGNVALSIAVKGAGGEILWAETYGTVRNAAGLKAASEKDPNTVEILYPGFCNTPELKQEWKEWQLSVRETLVQESMADTDASVGLTAGSNLSADTAFQAASVSKPITAVAVMRLVQSGLLDLDADIRSYLKDGEGWKLVNALPQGAEPTEPTTIRQLLGHAAGTSCSGFGGYRRNKVKQGSLQVPGTTEAILKGEGNGEKVELSALPNIVGQYSGGGTTVVQHIVEVVTGKPLHQVILEEIVQPLNLSHTSADLNDSPNGGDFACGHCGSEGLPCPGGYNLYPETGAAGVWTTASELCKISDAVYQSLQGRQVNGAVYLTKELAQEMLTPRFPSIKSGTAYGIGWGITDIDGSLQFEHNGGNDGYRSNCVCFADSGAGIAFLLSGEWTDQVFAGVTALKKYYKMPIRETATTQSEEGGDEGEVKATVFPSSLADCIGTYLPRNPLLSRNNTVIRVSGGPDSNTLVFHFDSIKGAISCKHAGDDNEKNSFSFSVLPRLDVQFTVDKGGKVLLSWSDDVHVFEKSE
ncbi:beta-lactamase/transpeptidase-like protein [Obelidium mucronatum]|nr:beta-lactamase/transpeptidase-like protein [Obelidium mucronatum]